MRAVRTLKNRKQSVRKAAPRSIETLERLDYLSASPWESLAVSAHTEAAQVDTNFYYGPNVHADPLAGQAEYGVSSNNLQALQMIGAITARQNYGYTGTGYTVAVIDTGVDYRHPNLSSRYLGGWDFVDNDADPMDLNGHGTHVAGTIVSTHGTHSGVAPGANLVALRVLDANGSGDFADVESALQWVVAHRSQYNIVSVNMSLGAGNYSTTPYTFLNDEFQSLSNAGVFIAASSGNSFYGYNSQQGLGFPAVSQYVVSVGAVYEGSYGKVSWGSGAIDYTTAADRVTSFTQRNGNLDILAPGAFLTSTYLRNSFATLAGTSMASPVVAGAAIIIHQAMDSLGLGSQATQEGILQVMRDTGVSIVDGDNENDNVTNTNLSFKRLNLNAALQSLESAGGGSAGDDDTLGLFYAPDSNFFLRNSLTTGVADTSFGFGPASSYWTALSGDWNGDGSDSVGLYNASTGAFYLRNSNTSGPADTAFTFGNGGNNWVPVAGDWNGDGIDTVGLYDTSTGTFHLRNSNNTGVADASFAFGPGGSGWTVLAGDWNGDGTDGVALYRQSDHCFFARNNLSSGFAESTFVFAPGGGTCLPVAGDWNGDGVDTMAVYSCSSATFHMAAANAGGTSYTSFVYGSGGSNWLPLAGRWSAATSSAASGFVTSHDGASLMAMLGNVLSAAAADGNHATLVGLESASLELPYLLDAGHPLDVILEDFNAAFATAGDTDLLTDVSDQVSTSDVPWTDLVDELLFVQDWDA